MKIIVSSEAEKELIKRFLSAMYDLDIIDELVKIDNDCGDGDTYLKSGDALFLREAMNDAAIVVGDASPLYVEHYNLTGTCVNCGTVTEGTTDGDDISYDDWLEQTSDERMKNWKCETCAIESEGV
jgi:hypothetical protein